MRKTQTFGQKLRDLAQLLWIIVSVLASDRRMLLGWSLVLVACLWLYVLDGPYCLVVPVIVGLGGLWMFGLTRSKDKALDSEQINQALTRLTVNIPAARWVALLTSDGLIKSCLPDRPPIQPDAIAAMNAAAFSLGERISDELGGDDLRYTLIAGVSGLHLCIVLNNNYLLALGLHPGVSVDAVLNTLRQSVAPIFDILEIEQPPSWLVA